MKYKPVIKWSGSKRNQCNDIIGLFPLEIDTYYEPFCGGCSILRGLIETINYWFEREFDKYF